MSWATARRTAKWVLPPILVVLIIAYVGIAYIVASGVTKAERKEQDDHPTDYGLEFEDVDFMSRRGDVTLDGWYLPGDDPGPTLIFVHGIGSKRTGDSATKLASDLVGQGFNVLMFDLRAHGTSEGDKVSGGIHERQDVLGAFDFLVERGVAPERVGVLGMSMGGGTSVLAVADEPAIQALVVDSPYAKVSELLAHEIARKTPIPKWIAPVFVPGAKLFADTLYDIDMGKLVPEEAVKELDYPILVIHGTGDTRIPFEHGERVHEAAHPESELWLVPDVDHVDAYIEYPEEYVNRVAPYFRSRLGGE